MNRPSTTSARGFEPVTALLLAVVVAGGFNVVGPVVSAVTLPSTIASLNEELGGDLVARDKVRGLVVSQVLWFAIPSFVLGLAMAATGMWALRRSGRLKGVRWMTVVGGFGLSVVLMLGLSLVQVGVSLGIRQFT